MCIYRLEERGRKQGMILGVFVRFRRWEIAPLCRSTIELLREPASF